MFMKKWWLEYEFKNGYIFEGWVNTTSESKRELEDQEITGTFYSYRDEKGCHGEAFIDGLNGEYPVIANGVFAQNVVYNSIKRNQLESWERFDAKIERCIVKSKTYIINF